MSDWIHCNRCTILLKDAKSIGLVFYLTNCGHILCAKCKSTISSNTCPVCQAVCNTVELNARIGPEIQVFFSEPAQLLKKHQKAELQVIEFQSQHIKRLLNSLLQERTQFDAESKRLQEENKRLTHELGMSKAEINRLRSKGRTPDPPSYPHTPPTKQAAATPRSVTPNQGFYTPMARSPSPMTMCTPVGHIRTPPGPMRYSLKSAKLNNASRSITSPSSPGGNQRIPFPYNSQRTPLSTPILTPGITSLLQTNQFDNRTPATANRNPHMSQNIPRSANKWCQQEYRQSSHLRNPLHIPPSRGITSKLKK